ncbi:hypothetical protein VaNZ11_006383 [Volvox africanus]|uniref:Uncharacterized protein n=1 Tax=Volvox africanus TaxID=51714 RepID=A0ABQ5S0L9_9CHLO|nr:hypothetical protein VaNZ11_006383 [Volvox africanus]
MDAAALARENTLVQEASKLYPVLELECEGKRAICLGGHENIIDSVNVLVEGECILISEWVLEHCLGLRNGTTHRPQEDWMLTYTKPYVTAYDNQPVPKMPLLDWCRHMCEKNGIENLRSGTRLLVFWWDMEHKSVHKLESRGKTWWPATYSPKYDKHGIWYSARVLKYDRATASLHIVYDYNSPADDLEVGVVTLPLNYVHFGPAPPARGGQAQVFPLPWKPRTTYSQPNPAHQRAPPAKEDDSMWQGTGASVLGQAQGRQIKQARRQPKEQDECRIPLGPAEKEQRISTGKDDTGSRQQQPVDCLILSPTVPSQQHEPAQKPCHDTLVQPQERVELREQQPQMQAPASTSGRGILRARHELDNEQKDFTERSSKKAKVASKLSCPGGTSAGKNEDVQGQKQPASGVKSALNNSRNYGSHAAVAGATKIDGSGLADIQAQLEGQKAITPAATKHLLPPELKLPKADRTSGASTATDTSALKVSSSLKKGAKPGCNTGVRGECFTSVANDGKIVEASKVSPGNGQQQQQGHWKSEQSNHQKLAPDTQQGPSSAVAGVLSANARLSNSQMRGAPGTPVDDTIMCPAGGSSRHGPAATGAAGAKQKTVNTLIPPRLHLGPTSRVYWPRSYPGISICRTADMLPQPAAVRLPHPVCEVLLRRVHKTSRRAEAASKAGAKLQQPQSRPPLGGGRGSHDEHLKQQGQTILSDMDIDDDVAAVNDHAAAVVDAVGRAGRASTAMDGDKPAADLACDDMAHHSGAPAIPAPAAPAPAQNISMAAASTGGVKACAGGSSSTEGGDYGKNGNVLDDDGHKIFQVRPITQHPELMASPEHYGSDGSDAAYAYIDMMEYAVKMPSEERLDAYETLAREAMASSLAASV